MSRHITFDSVFVKSQLPPLTNLGHSKPLEGSAEFELFLELQMQLKQFCDLIELNAKWYRV